MRVKQAETVKLRSDSWLPLKSCAVAVVGLMATVAIAQTVTIQKWVDEKGRVHFGDVPPPEAKTTDVQVKVTPPGEIPPPKPVTTGNNSAPKDAKASKEEAEEKRRREAIEGATTRQRMEECQKRIAAVQRDGRNVRNWARQGTDTSAADGQIAKQDDWISKNCS
jgi:type IV secretory pathway VirB10-like protein